MITTNPSLFLKTCIIDETEIGTTQDPLIKGQEFLVILHVFDTQRKDDVQSAS